MVETGNVCVDIPEAEDQLPEWVEMVCSVGMPQSTGLACLSKKFDRQEASFIGQGAPRHLRTSPALIARSLDKSRCLSISMYGIITFVPIGA